MNPSSAFTASPTILSQSCAGSLPGLKSSGHFSRIETKFFISKLLRPELESLVRRFLQPSYPDRATRFNLIESIYFDSAGLCVYRDHFLVTEGRFKIRLRRYGPDGVWNDHAIHLELKAKKNGLSEKYRICIGVDDYFELLQGRKISSPRRLKFLNSKLKPKIFWSRFEEIQNIMTGNRFRPCCKIQYQREEYEGVDLRVTLDDRLSYEILNRPDASVRSEILGSSIWQRAKSLQQAFHSDEYFVLEVKHLGPIQAWLADFLKSSSAQERSFSKYCFCLSHHLSQHPRGLPQ